MKLKRCISVTEKSDAFFRRELWQLHKLKREKIKEGTVLKFNLRTIKQKKLFWFIVKLLILTVSVKQKN